MTEQDKKILNGRYEIVHPIGYGGMAEVFLGRDILLERSVAIKMLRNQFHQEKELLEQFRREAKSAAKLVHPNIINVYDVVSENSSQYIVMEYVDGVTLKDYIQKNKLSLESALDMSINLADALQHAHQHNIIHCDIKPQNILVDKNLHPKIADFGIAKIISGQTMVYSNAIMGSVHYISPEQAEGGQVTASSDVYSLGIVLFEMLTGKVPYEGESAFAVMRMHAERKIPQLEDYLENVPEGLQEIINSALAKKAEGRYTSAESFKHDLVALKTSLFPYSKGDYPLDMEDADATLIMKPVTAAADQSETELPVAVEEKKTLDYTRIILLFTAAVVAVSFCAHLFFSYGGKTTAVPSVLNLSVVEAQRALEKEDFKVELEEEFGDPAKFAAGTVMEQTPAAGKRIRQGSVITLKISKGTELTEVPDVKGMLLDKAERILSEAGFKVGKVERKFENGIRANAVVSQSPKGKDKSPKGSAIDLVVNEDNTANIKVPAVKGKKLDEARKLLQNAGLQLGDVHTVKNDSVERNVVLDAYPGEGVALQRGRRVDLTVADGGDKASGYVEFVVPGTKSVLAQIIMEDKRGRSVVYRSKQNGGVRIRQKIEYTGSCRVQFICDGRVIEEIEL